MGEGTVDSPRRRLQNRLESLLETPPSSRPVLSRLVVYSPCELRFCVQTNDSELDDNLGLMRGDAESTAVRSVGWIRWMKQQRPRHGLQSPMIQRGLR